MKQPRRTRTITNKEVTKRLNFDTSSTNQAPISSNSLTPDVDNSNQTKSENPPIDPNSQQELDQLVMGLSLEPGSFPEILDKRREAKKEQKLRNETENNSANNPDNNEEKSPIKNGDLNNNSSELIIPNDRKLMPIPMVRFNTPTSSPYKKFIGNVPQVIQLPISAYPLYLGNWVELEKVDRITKGVPGLDTNPLIFLFLNFAYTFFSDEIKALQKQKYLDHIAQFNSEISDNEREIKTLTQKQKKLNTEQQDYEKKYKILYSQLKKSNQTLELTQLEEKRAEYLAEIKVKKEFCNGRILFLKNTNGSLQQAVSPYCVGFAELVKRDTKDEICLISHSGYADTTNGLHQFLQKISTLLNVLLARNYYHVIESSYFPEENTTDPQLQTPRTPTKKWNGNNLFSEILRLQSRELFTEKQIASLKTKGCAERFMFIELIKKINEWEINSFWPVMFGPFEVNQPEEQKQKNKDRKILGLTSEDRKYFRVPKLDDSTFLNVVPMEPLSEKYNPVNNSALVPINNSQDNSISINIKIINIKRYYAFFMGLCDSCQTMKPSYLQALILQMMNPKNYLTPPRTTPNIGAPYNFSILSPLPRSAHPSANENQPTDVNIPTYTTPVPSG